MQSQVTVPMMRVSVAISLLSVFFASTLAFFPPWSIRRLPQLPMHTIWIDNAPDNEGGFFSQEVELENNQIFSDFVKGYNARGIRHVNATKLLTGLGSLVDGEHYELIFKNNAPLDDLQTEVAKIRGYIGNVAHLFEKKANRATVALLERQGYTNVRIVQEGIQMRSAHTSRIVCDLDGVIQTDQGSFVIESKVHAKREDVDAAKDRRRLALDPDTTPLLNLTPPTVAILATNSYSEQLLQDAKSAGVWVVAPIDGPFDFVSQ